MKAEEHPQGSSPMANGTVLLVSQCCPVLLRGATAMAGDSRDVLAAHLLEPRYKILILFALQDLTWL